MLAMPVEKSGPERVRLPVRRRLRRRTSSSFDPDFSKVLVRYNPDGDAEMNERQTARLKRLAGLAARARPQVPVRAARAGRGGPARAGRRRRGPLRRRAAPGADAPHDRGVPGRRRRGRHLEDRGRSTTQEDCARDRRDRPAATGATASSAWCSAAAPTTPRSTTGCAQGAPVEGYAGFAIGRTIWWDALKGFLDGDLERDAAAQQIADNYLRFVHVYDDRRKQAAPA